MKNYEIKKTSAPNIYTLYDEDKNPIADVRGKDLAKQLAALPGLLEWLNERVAGCRKNEMIAQGEDMVSTEITCGAMRCAYQSVIDKILGKNE